MTDSGNDATGVSGTTYTGSGTYSLTDSGPGATLTSGSSTYSYTDVETGDAKSGTLSQTLTGTDRYGLLEYFNDVSNRGSGKTPGNMNFSPIGRAFVDPVTPQEAARIVNGILDGTRPLTDLRLLTPAQIEAEIQIIQRAVTNPRGAYPEELASAFNEARIAFLRGAGERPGSLLQFAERWLARQTPEWLRANAEIASRILSRLRTAQEMTVRRAAEAAAARAAQRGPSTLSRVARFLLSPVTMAISEILLDPTPTAGAARLPTNTLMLPPSSPDIYELPLGTFIMPNGLIYIPDAQSTFGPPPGSLVVTGRVVGNCLDPRSIPPSAVSRVPP